MQLEMSFAALDLPIAAYQVDDAVAALGAYMDAAGIAESDRGATLSMWAQRWELDQRTGIYVPPSKGLRNAMSAALEGGDPEFWDGRADEYFKAHRRLVEGGLAHVDAVSLLSYLAMSVRLLDVEAMSQSQVAKVLQARRGGRPVHWKQVERMTRAFADAPKVSPEDTELLSVADRDSIDLRFGDASKTVELERITGALLSLGAPQSVSGHLERLVEGGMDPGLMVMLHFQCVVGQFYDHPLTDSREFSPRGAAGDAVQNLHPSYEPSQSAWLNIAKGVSRLTSDGWAWGRDNERKPLALVGLLEDLESMSFGARREACGWIRQWLLRIEERQAPPSLLNAVAKVGQVEALLDLIRAGNSGTSGVFEQRMVDALASVILRAEAGWVSRGVGDSVFASNLSRKKLGDCEFTHAADLRIVAFEPHAGTLADVYVDNHLHSLRWVMNDRSVDLETLGPPAKWLIEVVFVAHDTGGFVDRSESIGGFPVQVRAITYSDLHGLVLASVGELIPVLNSLVVEPLNHANTPQRIRDRLREATGL